MSSLLDLNTELAACADADPDTFFPTGTDAMSDVVMAKAICHDCPIKVQCLLVAMTNDYDGIWGETTEGERRAFKRIQVTGR